MPRKGLSLTKRLRLLSKNLDIVAELLQVEISIRRVIVILCLVIEFLLVCDLQAKEVSINPKTIDIIWQQTVETPGDEINERSWKKSCDFIAESYLHSERGPFGFGLFRQHECFFVGLGEDLEESKSLWKLIFRRADGVLEISIEFRGENLKTINLPVRVRKALVPLLLDDRLNSLLAGTLYHGIPFLGKLRRSDLKRGYILGRKKPGSPTPPEMISFYSLKWNLADKRWQPEYLGRSSEVKLIKGKYVWALPKLANKSPHVFFHDSEGPEKFSQKFETKILSEWQRVQGEDETWLIQRGGIVGVRYGVPFVNNEVVASGSAFVGSLMEFHSGLLRGLTMLYDQWPTIEKGNGEKKSSLSVSRAQIGYRLGIEFELSNLKIGLTPLLGYWILDGSLPVASTGGTFETLVFGINEFNYDAVVDIRWDIATAYVRAWYGFSFGSFVDRKSGGLDIFIALPNLNIAEKVYLSLIGFYFQEENSFRKEEGFGRVGGKKLRKFEFNPTVVGGGLVLGW